MLKIKLTPFLKYSHLILLIFILLLTFIFGWFLYKDFYQTITQSQMILILKKEVALAEIDTSLFREVVKTLEEKKTPLEIKIEKDPFKPL